MNDVDNTYDTLPTRTGHPSLGVHHFFYSMPTRPPPGQSYRHGMHTHFSYSTSNPSRDQTGYSMAHDPHKQKKKTFAINHAEHKLTGVTQYIRYIKKTSPGRIFQGSEVLSQRTAGASSFFWNVQGLSTLPMSISPWLHKMLTINKTLWNIEECAQGLDLIQRLSWSKREREPENTSIPYWRISMYW